MGPWPNTGLLISYSTSIKSIQTVKIINANLGLINYNEKYKYEYNSERLYSLPVLKKLIDNKSLLVINIFHSVSLLLGTFSTSWLTSMSCFFLS